jgi:hypothetical protein
MAKNKISEYSSTAANNTDVANINIAEGCSPSNINNAIRAVMGHLKDFQDGSSGDSLTNAGTLNVTGNFQLDGSAGTSGQVLLSAGSGATPTWGNAFVTGMIMMWSGTIATIPSGWYLCDGTNSTPDLRNKFIVAADADDAGAAKTTITGSATQSGGSKDAINVSHTHTITDAGHNHFIANTDNVTTNASPTLSATNYLTRGNGAQAGTGNAEVYALQGSATTPTVGLTSTKTTGITIDSAGSSGTNANLPPYYALAFIMKG